MGAAASQDAVRRLRHEGDTPTNLRLALLGDSTFDNGNWVAPGAPALIDQVRILLGCGEAGDETDSNAAILLARDGALVAALDSQAKDVPLDTTHVVVSVGGNDALSAVKLLSPQQKRSGETGSETDVVGSLWRFSRLFEREFEEQVESVRDILRRRCGPNAPKIIVCSVYNPCFAPFEVTTVSQAAANAGAALIFDAVLRVCTRAELPLLDWRRVMTDVADFANPIEPSSVGGLKMAREIVTVALQHPFESHMSVVYPQRCPPSALTDLEPGEFASADDLLGLGDNIVPPVSISEVPDGAGAVAGIRAAASQERELGPGVEQPPTDDGPRAEAPSQVQT
jgi:lysophospholipase L1-like esterase